jgi:hypothetical protein
MYETTALDSSTAASTTVSPVVAVIYWVVIIVSLVAMWKVFSKAGQAGWKSLIPFYNAVVAFKIAGMNPWLLLLFFVPLANIVVAIMFGLNLAKSFGRSPVFGVVGLAIFSPIGMLMLAFGKSQYVGPGGVAAPVAAAPVAPAPPVAPVV